RDPSTAVEEPDVAGSRPSIPEAYRGPRAVGRDPECPEARQLAETSHLLSLATEPPHVRIWPSGNVDEEPILGDGEPRLGSAHEVIDVVHDQTRFAMEACRFFVEWLRKQGPLPSVDQVSGRDVFHSGI